MLELATHGPDHASTGEAALLVIAMTVFVVAIMGLGIRSMRKAKERKARYAGPDHQRFTGSLTERIGLQADPQMGRGFVLVGRNGLYFTRQNAWAGGGGTTWGRVVTFARKDRLLQIEFRRESGAGDHAAIQFKSKRAVEVEQIARQHLMAHEWRNSVDFGPEGKWDSFYSAAM